MWRLAPILLLCSFSVTIAAAQEHGLDRVVELTIQGEADTARRHLEALADAGDPDAMLILGQLMLPIGNGGGSFQPDFPAAVNWLQRAAEAGNSWAMLRMAELRGFMDAVALAQVLEHDSARFEDYWNPSESMDWARQAAQAGNATAILTAMLHAGPGVESALADCADPASLRCRSMWGALHDALTDRLATMEFPALAQALVWQHHGHRLILSSEQQASSEEDRDGVRTFLSAYRRLLTELPIEPVDAAGKPLNCQPYSVGPEMTEPRWITTENELLACLQHDLASFLHLVTFDHGFLLEGLTETQRREVRAEAEEWLSQHMPWWNGN